MRQFVEVSGGAIEYELTVGTSVEPALVFLHEGLGSIDLWRGVPDEIGRRTGNRSVLVYARHGYGQSAPARLPLPTSYMHHEADVVLPEVLDALDIERPVLVGHSDGASIALLYAGAGYPVAELVLLAPHVFVESESIAGIEAAREAFETTDMVERMRRYHRDPEATFRGWNDVWLSPGFRTWDITDRLSSITAPALLVQGSADQYGTFAQLEAIESMSAGPVDQHRVEGAGHAPHLDARDDVVAAISAWLELDAG